MTHTYEISINSLKGRKSLPLGEGQAPALITWTATTRWIHGTRTPAPGNVRVSVPVAAVVRVVELTDGSRRVEIETTS